MKPAILNPLTFPLQDTRLIEASAGTGKTYTIAALYVRLILGHQHDPTETPRYFLPPEILVVTFTDAATKELRERIRDRLSQAARYFREHADAEDDFLAQLRLSYPADSWSACARRLELAANWMDEAAVYTIHGWCNRMLQQYAFDSGSLFDLEVNTHDTELLQEVVRDYWRSFFYPLPLNTCQQVLKICATPEALQRLLNNLLSETEATGLECQEDITDVFNSWEQWEGQRQEKNAIARQLWSNDQEAIEQLLITALEKSWLNGNKYRKDNFRQKLQDMALWAKSNTPITLEVLEKFGEQQLHAGLVNAHKTKSDQLKNPAFIAIDDLVKHSGSEIELKQKIILHAIHWIRDRYQQEKQRIARITFDDMLTRLDQALQGSNGAKLAEIIRQKYPIALIDEFQDTDPIQYRIFSTLYRIGQQPENVGCFMIGDPKQAIYSFRGADIFTYLQAHQDTEGRHYTLDTNYRSTQELVDAVNQVFVQADQQPLGAFRFNDGAYNPLPFNRVKAKGRETSWIQEHRPGSALTFWHWSERPYIGLPDYRNDFAEVTASEIVRLLNSAAKGHTGFKKEKQFQALQPADIAILVRNGTEAKAMRRALSRRQIRSVYLSEKDSIFASQEAIDIVFWLRAFAEPRNEQKVRAAIGTATFYWSIQQLQQLVIDEPLWETHLERFLHYQQRWQQDGILPAIRQLMNDYGIHQQLIKAVDGERALTNLLHLAELLQRASIQLDGEPALIRYLMEAIEDQNSGMGDEDTIRLESDANLIKIITIHKSKGLEYPLVFLPFVCSFRDISRDSFYRYHDSQKRLTIDLSKQNIVKKYHESECLQEDIRLLYVALTRAQYACWLGIAPVKYGNIKNCQLEKSAMGALLGWKEKMSAENLVPLLQQLKGDCAAIEICDVPKVNFDYYRATQATGELDQPRQATHKISKPWWVASYSSLALSDRATPGTAPHLAQEPENPEQDKQRDEADSEPTTLAQSGNGVHGFARGTVAGTLIHALMEQCAKIGFSSVAQNTSMLDEFIMKYFTGPNWLNKQDSVRQATQEWLHHPLFPDKSLCLAELAIQDYQAEFEFLIGIQAVQATSLDALICAHFYPDQARPALQPTYLNGLLKGFIDLVFVHEHRYYLLDYKFNSLGNNDCHYTEEALINAMLQKRYDAQASLYLLALHRLLRARLGADYDYTKHVGGYVYLFLRGTRAASGGRQFDKPSLTFIEQLDTLFHHAQPQEFADD